MTSKRDLERTEHRRRMGIIDTCSDAIVDTVGLPDEGAETIWNNPRDFHLCARPETWAKILEWAAIHPGSASELARKITKASNA